ncbi:hypothetical protein AMR72_15300 [Flavobacterium psychrophilum]|nr:hypothetical protein AMR72_15300 [Flavobacterium psychrophilum]AOE53758.1 hypothetical protein ALW18_15290 [Flavobacterium psychrophilum]
MSVTKNAPDGYDYQYLASLYAFLLLGKSRKIAEAYIDREGFGDLTLIFTDHRDEPYEFEFKNRKPGFDEKYFVECISKFSAHSDSEYILSKLSTGKIKRFYLITSTRVEQFAADFFVITTKSDWSKPLPQYKKKIFEAFRAAVLKYNQKDEPRDKYVASHIGSATDLDLKNLLEGIYLVDQLDEDQIRARIHDLLSDLTIALSHQGSLINKLIDVIKNSKTSGLNIADTIYNELHSLQSWSLPVDEHYLLMGDEASLLDELSSRKIVLLTGSTLCGKTQRAYYIAQQLLKNYPSAKFLPVGEVHMAEQFLLNYDAETKICYLEDPLGQYRDDVGMVAYKQLEGLLRRMPKYMERYLIVTATTEITTAISKSGYMSEFTWHDLTVREAPIACKIWNALSSGSGFDHLIQKMVVETIETADQDAILQPGQLKQLVGSLQANRPGSLEQVRHLASAKAQDITNVITSRGESVTNAMIILGLGATIQKGLYDIDLSYLEHSEPDYLPGINDDETGVTGTSISALETVYMIPEYKSFTASVSLRGVISQLIDYGYIRAFGDGSYVFAHPVYQEAARRLLDGNNPMRFEAALRHCRKLLGCLNPSLALQSAKNLYLLYTNALNQTQRQIVFDLATLAIRSTFVVVREEALLFLVAHRNALNEMITGNVKDAFQHRNDFGTGNYCWQGQILFIPDAKHLETCRSRNYRSKRQCLDNWEAYLSRPVSLEPAQAFELMDGLLLVTKSEKRQLSFDYIVLKAFLRYREGVIRERAAYLIAASITEETFADLTTLYYENDPFVKFQLIRGLFRSWPYMTDKNKKSEVLAFMQATFDEPFVILGAIGLFTEFAAGYARSSFDWMYEIQASIKKHMWFLWGELMVVLFRHLPTDVHVNHGRFSATLAEAQISKEARVKIIFAYLDWLPAYFKDSGRYWDMSEIFIFFLRENFLMIPKVRRIGLIKKMLLLEDTEFVASMANLLISNWGNLNDKEKKVILSALPSLGRKGQLAAFSCPEATVDVQLAATGVSILGLSTTTIANTLTEDFIKELLSAVYLDYSRWGVANLNKVVFDPLLYYYIDKTDKKPFAVAVRVFLDDFLFNSSRNGLWKKPKSLIDGIVSGGNAHAFLLTTTILLHDLIVNRGSRAGILLDVLYKDATQDNLATLSVKIINNLEGISYSENLKSVKNYISEYYQDNFILEKSISMLLDMPSDNDDHTIVKKGFAKIILFGLEQKKLRLHHYLLYFRDWADKNTHLMEEQYKPIINDYFSYLHGISREQAEAMEQEIVNSSSYLNN